MYINVRHGDRFDMLTALTEGPPTKAGKTRWWFVCTCNELRLAIPDVVALEARGVCASCATCFRRDSKELVAANLKRLAHAEAAMASVPPVRTLTDAPRVKGERDCWSVYVGRRLVAVHGTEEEADMDVERRLVDERTDVL